MTVGAGVYRRVLASRYRIWATQACFSSDKGPLSFTIPAIDLTRGVEIGDGLTENATLEPVASVRAADLCALQVEAVELVDGVLTLNGVEWIVVRTEPKPGPFGPLSGEVHLMLVRSDG